MSTDQAPGHFKIRLVRRRQKFGQALALLFKHSFQLKELVFVNSFSLPLLYFFIVSFPSTLVRLHKRFEISMMAFFDDD